MDPLSLETCRQAPRPDFQNMSIGQDDFKLVVLRRARITDAFPLGPYLAGAGFVLVGWSESLRQFPGV